MFSFYANPTRFLRLRERLSPWLLLLSLAGLGAGIIWGLFYSPPDYQQGETVRIMYLHVPFAWMSMFCYAWLAGSAALYLIYTHRLADLFAQAFARVGAVLTLLCLVTGSIWGKPTWGTWWVWDARLTSVLLMFFLYIAYCLLRAREESGKRAAILALLGAVNLPVIKFSVDWWNTLHQPASISRLSSPAIHPDLLWPLLLCAGGLLALTLWLSMAWVETLWREARVVRREAQHD
ncbi:MAG: cytochrome c biogenesis protein CcsA [Thalassospira sp.]|nr:cytochrome c biogenesis protein CcsA [Thalassospira sp.]